jgi:nicotinate phosphoribosyltransferase
MIESIITSLMDVDFYKFTMGQLIYKHYKGTKVKFVLTDRNNQRLALSINERFLREQLDHIRTLRFTMSEIHYLRGTNEYSERMFNEDYLQFLTNLKLPEFSLKTADNGGFDLEFYGNWEEVTYWETLAMSVINELYFMNELKNYSTLEHDVVFANGIKNLSKKVEDLTYRHNIVEFGTRRRFSKAWQERVLQYLIDERNVNLKGTSNTYLAMKHNILPMGTFAHELDQGIAGVHYNDLHKAHNELLEKWWEMYGWGLSIALPDTYTTDFFLENFSTEQAEKWKGFRHDSGDPIMFGYKILDFYKQCGIDPLSKLIIFSDGLNINTIHKIYDTFNDKINLSFGWGTNLTNDLGLNPLNIVVKVKESNGNEVMKISDEPKKNSKVSKETIKHYESSLGIRIQ